MNCRMPVAIMRFSLWSCAERSLRLKNGGEFLRQQLVDPRNTPDR
jgi:hypothetical protein